MSNPLINLRTDLRSLKFSGASRENSTGREVRKKSPYVITPIPPKNSQGVDTVSNLDASAKKGVAESQDENNKINGKNTKEKKRVSKASQKLDIVNVDNATKEKKGGWWSQSKT